MFKGLKSLVTGIVAGTALGVLFSPKKGKEIRKSFKKEVEEGGYGLSTAKELLTDMGEEIGDAYHKITDSEGFKKASDKAKKYASKAGEKAKEAYKKNVPAATLKKAKKAMSKAKSTVKKVTKRLKK